MPEDNTTKSKPGSSVSTAFILIYVGNMCIRFLPVYLFGLLCRPLWRRWMRSQIRKLEKNQDDPGKAQAACSNRVWLIYESQSAWSEVMPWLQQLKEPKYRMDLARAFALLFLHNHRPGEAIEAARYWSSNAEEWVREHLHEARKALRLYKKLSGWHLRPQQSESEDIVGGKEAFKVMRRISNLSTGTTSNAMVREYRDSRVALSLLKWRQNQQADKKASIAL